MSRHLLITAYDVTDANRLAAARVRVSEWAHGGQKSVWECFAARRDRAVLGSAMMAPLDPKQDRLTLLLPRQRGILTLGRAEIADDGPLIFLG